jgi:hypothetical protein
LILLWTIPHSFWNTRLVKDASRFDEFIISENLGIEAFVFPLSFLSLLV